MDWYHEKTFGIDELCGLRFILTFYIYRMGNHHKLSKVCIEVLDATQVEKRTCKKASKVINNKSLFESSGYETRFNETWKNGSDLLTVYQR